MDHVEEAKAGAGATAVVELRMINGCCVGSAVGVEGVVGRMRPDASTKGQPSPGLIVDPLLLGFGQDAARPEAGADCTACARLAQTRKRVIPSSRNVFIALSQRSFEGKGVKDSSVKRIFDQSLNNQRMLIDGRAMTYGPDAFGLAVPYLSECGSVLDRTGI